MLSPFPGMDPYLEEFWGDVHHSMITHSVAAIQRELPPGLFARIDVREFVEPEGEKFSPASWMNRCDKDSSTSKAPGRNARSSL